MPWIVAGASAGIAILACIRAAMYRADALWCIDEDDRQCDELTALRVELERERAAGWATAQELGRALKWSAHLEAALTLDRRAPLRAQYEDAELLRSIERKAVRHG